MFPQIVTSDSLKKSADKLPFAPFLSPETIEKQNAIEKKSNDVKSATVKKNTRSSLPKQEKKAETVKEKNTKLVTPPQSVQLPVKDTSIHVAAPATQTTVITDSASADSTLGQNISRIDSTEFKFADDDLIEKTAGNFFEYSNSSKYFGTHKLTSKSESPQVHTRFIPDWFTVILILIICGITLIKILYSKIFTQLFEAFYSLAVTNQVVRDENILVQRASVLLNIIFYAIAALFLYFVSVNFDWDNPFYNQGVFRFFLFAIVVACFYSLKMLLLKLLGFILEIEKPVAIYIFNIFLINNILGIALIPIIVLLAYVPSDYTVYILYTGIGIILIAFLYRIFRAFSIGSTLTMGSLYYLILYFCTLEIAPVLLIAKIAGR